MRLADSLLGRMKAALARQQQPAAGGLGAATPRVGMHARVTVVPYGVEAVAAMGAVVADVWDDGLAMLCPYPLEPGRAVAVLVPCGERKPLRVLCTVAHCRPGDDGFVVSTEYGAAAVDSLAHVLAMPRQTLLAAA
ncbi:MAG TPA: hypothetical protein VK324_14205 [Tepidisphaeraceae bacterium]|nr:hypothetical protein [Tepidisphaeraceae bacterium]